MAVGHLAESQADSRGAEQRAELVHRLLMQHGVGKRRQPGQQQPHIRALGDQCLRQRSKNVCKTAGLDEGKYFRANMKHLH